MPCPYVKIHNGEWDESTDVQVRKGDSLVIGPHPWEGGRWVWSGPKDFKSTDREIRFKNMDGTMSGYYKAVHTNASGCENSVTIKVVVDDPDHPFVEPDTTKDTSITALYGFGGRVSEICTGSPVQVFDVQGHYLGTMREESVRSLNAGVYLLRAGKNVRKIRVE